MATKTEMGKVRMVLDYLPCENCRGIPCPTQDYLCTLCERLDRVVTTDRITPRWEMAKGSLVSANDSRIEDLKPIVIIHEPYEEEPCVLEEKKVIEEHGEIEPDELDMELEQDIFEMDKDLMETDEEDIEPPVEKFELLEINEGDTVPETHHVQMDEEDIPEWAPVDEEIDNPFMVGDYTLYTKVVTLRGDRKQRLYFFSKKKKNNAAAIKKPRGYKVIINKKTGLPLLKKKTLIPSLKRKK